MTRARSTLVLAAIVMLACVSGALPRAAERPLSPLARPPDAGSHWPLPPEEATRLLREGRLELRGLERTAAGKTGAMQGRAWFPERGIELAVKWKVAPPGDADDWNNSPRKELAAYRIQRWFLEPRDYVVPSVAVRCIPLERYRREVPEAEPTFEGTRCVLGSVSLWLRDVRPADPIFEPKRFRRDPIYAYHLANLNLLTYLIRHRDAKVTNFLEATDPDNRRVFSVDNGIAFETFRHNPWVENWDQIRIPALRAAALQRLRQLEPADYAELSVLEEFALGPDGVLRPAPPGPVRDPEEGVRRWDGGLQLGLTRDEIQGLRQRSERLLAQGDRS